MENKKNHLDDLVTRKQEDGNKKSSGILLPVCLAGTFTTMGNVIAMLNTQMLANSQDNFPDMIVPAVICWTAGLVCGTYALGKTIYQNYQRNKN